MNSQDDDSNGWVLGVVFGVVALVIALVFGVTRYQAHKNQLAMTATATATATAATAADAAAKAAAAPMAMPAADDGASVKVEDGVVKFYFATGQSAVASGGNEALADIVRAVAAGKTVVISGFHDATGDAGVNAELAKQRAFKVRDALLALGVTPNKVELRKPEQTLATGSNSEARRVEVAAQ